MAVEHDFQEVCIVQNGLNRGYDGLLDDADDGMMTGAAEKFTATEEFMYRSEAGQAKPKPCIRAIR